MSCDWDRASTEYNSLTSLTKMSLSFYHPSLGIGRKGYNASGGNAEVLVEVKDHTQQVGAIVTNLQALETVLRYHSMGPKAREVQFPTVGAPDAVENDLTSYVSLGKLIKRFNNSLGPDEQQYKVDSQVVVIRDAFAHGRLVTIEEKLPFHLWKFGKPDNRRVPIEFHQELTLEWLTKTRDMILAQKQKVIDCFNARGYQGLR
jgi:hypothetical protein